MSFHPVYYIINGWPSFEKTREMVEKYVEHGVRAIQIDMASTDPYGESDYIKEKMAYALDKYGLDYAPFMDNIRAIRARHPSLELHIVVYPDVVAAIGRKEFADFCEEVGTYTIRNGNRENMEYCRSRGLSVGEFVTYTMPEQDVEPTIGADNIIIMLRSNKDHPEWIPRDGMRTWKQRIAWLRERGVTGEIYPVAGILTKQQLVECKEAGAQGAYIGTALMKMWDDEPALWKLLDEFESVAE